MAQSKIQNLSLIVSIDHTLSVASTSDEDAATQSPRSTANSFNASSTETPWSSFKSGESQDSRVTADDDGISCTDEDASTCHEQQDDYYAFLREFAGSFDASDEEEGQESETGSQDGDIDGEQEEEGIRETQRHMRKRSRVLSSAEADSLEAASSFSGSPCPRDGAKHLELGGGSAEEEEDDDHSDAGSESEDETPVDTQQHLGEEPREASSSHVIPSGEYPSPDEDDYDVVKAVREYAVQRPGNRMQQWCEDMQSAIRLRRMQASSLTAPAMNPQVDPKVRAHYARMRFELLMQAKALEARFLQVVGGSGPPGTPSQHPLLCSRGVVR